MKTCADRPLVRITLIIVDQDLGIVIRIVIPATVSLRVPSPRRLPALRPRAGEATGGC